MTLINPQWGRFVSRTDDEKGRAGLIPARPSSALTTSVEAQLAARLASRRRACSTGSV